MLALRRQAAEVMAMPNIGDGPYEVNITIRTCASYSAP